MLNAWPILVTRINIYYCWIHENEELSIYLLVDIIILSDILRPI